MAELILGSVVESITGQLISLATTEIGLARGVGAEMKKLQDTVSAITAHIREAEKRRDHTEDVKNWLDKLNDVLYDADDLLDDFSTEALRRRRVTGRGKRILNEMRTFCSCTNQFIYTSSMAHRVIEIRERINNLADNKVRFQLERSTTFGSSVVNRVRPETYPYEPEMYVTGRDKDKEQIVDFLLCPAVEEDVSVLPIVGFGGLGKTTLARLVFNDEKVKEYFSFKVWICVSTNFEVEDIMSKIVQGCGGKVTTPNADVNELKKMLHGLLKGKLLLVVLDDVWNENRQKWLTLEGYLNIGVRGNKILVTTRSTLVAKTMTDTFHKLSALQEDESLSLLMRMARKKEHDLRSQNLEGVARQILKKCIGVPLAIITIGRLLLFSRNTEEDWLMFNNDLCRINQEEGDIMPSLKLSYDFLPSQLKQCFAYCSLFPKDHELRPSELINLWTANGFIEPLHEKQTTQDAGEVYFKELLLRSFFQDAEEDMCGHIIRCKMHDLMHDLAQLVAGRNCSSIDGSSVKEIPKVARHVSIVDSDAIEWSKFESGEKARSLLVIGQKKEWLEINHLDVSYFKNLRALRFQGTEIKSIPHSIGKLKHLRSLNLSKNLSLRYIPDSISELCNLETLNLSCCFQLESLPNGILKLVNLSQLNLWGCSGLTHIPKGIGKLSKLQILGMFMVGEKGNRNAAKFEELSSLTGLRKMLSIERMDRLLDEEVISIEKLAIPSLHLHWDTGFDEVRAVHDEQILVRFRPNSDLKELNIFGYHGNNFPSWVSRLQNLVKIAIDINHGQCKRLPPLDHLPFLKSISLSDLFDLECIELSVGGGLLQSNNLFPSLEEIKLKDLLQFKGWEMRRGEGNDYDQENNDDSMLLFFVFSIKVKLSIEDCLRFSYSQGEQTHLSLTTMGMLQNLLRNNGTIGRSDSLSQAQSQLQLAREPSMAHNPPTLCTIPVSSVPLSRLTSLTLSFMEDAEHFPVKLFHSLPSLRSLEIKHCPHLKALPVKTILRHSPALEKLEIVDCDELDLSSEDCNMDEDVRDEEGAPHLPVEGHIKLQTVIICRIHKMESLPGWFQLVSNPKHLEIVNCDGVKCLLPGRQIIRLLSSLESLEIYHCPELDLSIGESEVDQEGMSAVQSPRPATLQKLTLCGLQKMESLPWWIQHLGNLEKLDFTFCDSLKALPEWLPDLPALQWFSIMSCGEELTRRCQKNKGKDWPKISHIETVHIN